MGANMIIIPEKKRGRPTQEDIITKKVEMELFAEGILKIQSTLDFKVSSRGWAYILENEGIITKGQFDTIQTLVNECRKTGLLPIDICIEDANRGYDNLENLDTDNIDSYFDNLRNRIKNTLDGYTPFSFWEDKEYYIEMWVEKIDLKSLFQPICEKYFIPLANAKGWPDINMRYQVMKRFKKHEREGRQCVLLYCGDHDPAGLAINENIRNMLGEVSGQARWLPDNLIINRFGLNYDFIMDNNLSWIDNLETGGKKDLSNPKHPDHGKPYVQEYLSKYGARKCEANALVTRPAAGRELCEKAINTFIPKIAPEIYFESLKPYREQAQREFSI